MEPNLHGKLALNFAQEFRGNLVNLIPMAYCTTVPFTPEKVIMFSHDVNTESSSMHQGVGEPIVIMQSQPFI